MGLVSDFHIAVTIIVDVPPGTSRDQASRMLVNSGISMPLGCLQLVRRVDVDVREGPAPAAETGGGLSLA